MNHIQITLNSPLLDPFHHDLLRTSAQTHIVYYTDNFADHLSSESDSSRTRITFSLPETPQEDLERAIEAIEIDFPGTIISHQRIPGSPESLLASVKSLVAQTAKYTRKTPSKKKR